MARGKLVCAAAVAVALLALLGASADANGPRRGHGFRFGFGRSHGSSRRSGHGGRAGASAAAASQRLSAHEAEGIAANERAFVKHIETKMAHFEELLERGKLKSAVMLLADVVFKLENTRSLHRAELHEELRARLNRSEHLTQKLELTLLDVLFDKNRKVSLTAILRKWIADFEWLNTIDASRLTTEFLNPRVNARIDYFFKSVVAELKAREALGVELVARAHANGSGMCDMFKHPADPTSAFVAEMRHEQRVAASALRTNKMGAEELARVGYLIRTLLGGSSVQIPSSMHALRSLYNLAAVCRNLEVHALHESLEPLEAASGQLGLLRPPVAAAALSPVMSPAMSPAVSPARTLAAAGGPALRQYGYPVY